MYLVAPCCAALERTVRSDELGPRRRQRSFAWTDRSAERAEDLRREFDLAGTAVEIDQRLGQRVVRVGDGVVLRLERADEVAALAQPLVESTHARLRVVCVCARVVVSGRWRSLR